MKNKAEVYAITPNAEGDAQELHLRQKVTALGNAWVAQLVTVRIGGGGSEHRYNAGVAGRKCGELDSCVALKKALAAVGAELIATNKSGLPTPRR